MSLKGVTGRVVIVCLAAALVALVALVAAGNARAGIAAAAGLVLGSVNGAIAGRALEAGLSPRATSLARLAVLTVAAIVVGLVIGLSYAWLVILGVAAAQLVLVGVAAGSLLRR